MMLRLTFAVGALGALMAFSGAAQAQDYPPRAYPPYGAQAYPPPAYRPLPPGAIPDDDDDIPPHQRATGNIPPPPGGYRGPFANEPRQAPGAIPPPGIAYGDRAAPPPYYGPPPGSRPGQPESYGAAPGVAYPNQATAPQAYPPPYQGQPPADQYQQGPQGPIQLSPGQRAAPMPPREVTGTVRPSSVAALPPEEQPDEGKPELPAHLKRQLVQFQSAEPAGTLVIDTANTYLYLVLGNGQAMRYGIGVGREGFTWAGAERVSRMAEWPDWYPPAEMIERQPYLPRMMAGGETNPLGARALYLAKTLYRIHGTNQPSTIGKYVSSGCIRLTNDDIADLYSRVQVGTRVVVLAGSPPATASNAPAQPQVQQR